MLDDSLFTRDKERFLQTIELFARKGYHATTVDEIASRLGVAKGTIYYHFKNKQEVYLEVIRIAFKILKDSALKAIEESDEPVVKLRKISKNHVEFLHEYADIAAIFLRELFSSSENKKLLTGLMQEYLQLIQSVIEDGINKGHFRKIDSRLAATAVHGMISTTVMHYINAYGNFPLELVSSDIDELILRGLLK